MRFAAAFIALLGLTVTGEARDLQRLREGEPQFEIIGFSQDGGAFAFVEYGFADWAGPYARLSIVDTASGAAFGGGPFRAGSLRDGAGIPDGSLPATEADYDGVLAEAATLADGALREAGLVGGDPSDAGHVLVFNPPTEMQQTARFVTRRGYAFTRTPLALTIADVPLAPPARCAFGIEGFAGVEIVLADDTGAELFRSREDAVPTERGCPAHYTITALVRHERTGATMLILMTESPSFEGRILSYSAVALPAL
ncbi:MAG: DUF2259 domain-containing protein [Bauldia sp.]|nr:DUF2259 domain-containing protein [Bauldia sp.]MCW5717731.1 DUF2259 domain-containing protein [Bauldia sp.]